ncbi:MAG: rhodanese-like domain-containing protein [Alcanivorax sp.]|nr:rhodanese-like domain-containing protein [Alcanivorax sp.]
MKGYRLLLAILAALPALVWAADPVSVTALADSMTRKQAPVIVDVRSEAEFLSGHIPGAIMIPVDRLEKNLELLRPHRKDHIVVYCQSGRRAHKAATELEEAGFKHVKLLDGSFQAWQAAGQPIAK